MIKNDTTNLLTKNVDLILQRIFKISDEMSCTYSIYLKHQAKKELLSELQHRVDVLVDVRTKELLRINNR